MFGESVWCKELIYALHYLNSVTLKNGANTPFRACSCMKTKLKFYCNRAFYLSDSTLLLDRLYLNNNIRVSQSKFSDIYAFGTVLPSSNVYHLGKLQRLWICDYVGQN